MGQYAHRHPIYISKLLSCFCLINLIYMYIPICTHCHAFDCLMHVVLFSLLGTTTIQMMTFANAYIFLSLCSTMVVYVGYFSCILGSSWSLIFRFLFLICNFWKLSSQLLFHTCLYLTWFGIQLLTTGSQGLFPRFPYL